jgi:hypothetical protein
MGMEMNERIRELAEQAWKEILDETSIDGDISTMFSSDEVVEFETKFAELIVAECLNMCADSDAALQRIKDREPSPDSEYVRYGAADYEWAAAYGKQIDHYESIADRSTNAGDKIREHFGVEE